MHKPLQIYMCFFTIAWKRASEKVEVSTIAIVENWEQAVTWLVLLAVLYSVVSGKIRYELAALGGLLFLGVLGIREQDQLFSGFASPALFTIAAVLVMSSGIVESGLLTGFGKSIGARMKHAKNQVFALFVTTALISAFMNNVGAIGIVLPTAKRMAQRSKISQSSFGIPIAYASILGGSLTLIGTASNLIVSTYRMGALGEPFGMFDFSFNGLALIFSGVFVLFICQICNLRPLEKVKGNDEKLLAEKIQVIEEPIPRNKAKSIIVVFTLVPVVVATSIRLIHPAMGFGLVTLVWIITGVLPYQKAIEHINIPIIIFLGSMFGISATLEETGALSVAVGLVVPLFSMLPPFGMILVFVLVTALFANILDNSVAAVLMAPVALMLWRTGVVAFNPDALFMAVAAGASLGIVLPSHQATIVVMESMDFPRKSFIILGAFIATVAVITATFVIYIRWC